MHPRGIARKNRYGFVTPLRLLKKPASAGLTHHNTMRAFSLLLRVAYAGAVLLLATALAAEESKTIYDIPAGEAAAALKQFSETSGRETLFAARAVRGVRTPAVRGEFTAQEAIHALLAGTGLVATKDEATGAFAVRQETPEEAKNVPRRLAETREAAVKNNSRVEDGAVILDKVEVTGSRIRGLLAEATAQPVHVIDSEQIERTGAQSIGDVLRYIPQVSSFTTGQASTQNGLGASIDFSTGGIVTYGTPTHIGHTAGLVTASLRGAPAGATLLLIDGKRAPKNNLASGRDGFDLNGIPLAAVDRIEVLLDGASSAYGADAMGGVINVILKKHYSGTELRLGYENTFDTDVGVVSGSLSHGFGSGKFRGLLTASWEESNEMMLRDRDFLASFDRRAYGGIDRRSTTIPVGAGRVSRTGSVPLPGLGSTQSAIPSGTDGTGLTIADYAAAGAIGTPYDAARYTQFAASYERYSVLGKFDYAWRDWLELYATVRAGRNRNHQFSAPIEAAGLSIPAGYAGNPFGIPIVLNKVFFDLQPELVSTDESRAFTLGAAGNLPKGWRYDASISQTSSHTRLDGEGGTSIGAALFAAAVAAGRTPNLFYDSSLVGNPNEPGVIEALTTLTRNEEKTQTWVYTLQVDGPVWTLPAGDIGAAFGVERREEYADFPLRAATDTMTALPGNDEINAYFAEVNVPIFGGRHRRPGLHQLNLSASYRFEDYGDDVTSKNPRVGVAWRPVRWMLLRGSYGEGSKIPTLQQRTQPVRQVNSTTVAIAANLDPLRGDTVNPVHPQINGGNPTLRPEISENTTAGLVLEIPAVEGLSLSFDWFDSSYKGRIATLTFNQMATLFPERITRGPNLPTDQPGWAGPVIAADLRAINVALSQTTGYDVGIRYDRDFGWGGLQAGASGTKYTRNISIPSPGGLPTPTVSTDSLPVQINGSVFVFRNAWGLGAMTTYRDASRGAPTEIFTLSAIRWDAQYSYDFAKAAWLSGQGDWLRHALADTKLSLTVYNVFNRVPPFNYLYFPDNTVLDSRLRRFAVSLRRTF